MMGYPKPEARPGVLALEGAVTLWEGDSHPKHTPGLDVTEAPIG